MSEFYEKNNLVFTGTVVLDGYRYVRISSCQYDKLEIRDCINVCIVGSMINELKIDGCVNVVFSGNRAYDFVVDRQDYHIYGNIIGPDDFVPYQNTITEGELDKEIHIRKNGPHGYHIYGQGNKFAGKNLKTCAWCSMRLYPQYTYIIDELKKAGLLWKEYPYLCCKCYREDMIK